MNPITIQIKTFKDNYNRTKEYANLSLLPTTIDYLWCAVKYGSSASDYFELEFYDKSGKARQRFLTYKLKMQLFHRVNDYSKKSLFDDKTSFFKTFPEYIHRDWLNTAEATNEEVLSFLSEHPTIIVKPIASSGGNGVKKITIGGGYYPI